MLKGKAELYFTVFTGGHIFDIFALLHRPSNKGARPAQGWSDFVLGGHILLVHVHAFQYCGGLLAGQIFSYFKT